MKSFASLYEALAGAGARYRYLLLCGLVCAFTPLGAEPIKPLQPVTGLDPQIVALGKKLFHDPRLSKDETISCASCHNLATGGADSSRVSVGIGGELGLVNSPTVYNSGLLFRQFWDGRVETLEEQIDGPIHAPFEMGMSWPDVVARLYGDADYPQLFRKAFRGGEISAANIKKAIADFERSLVTLNAPFDRYLQGDEEAITKQQKRGYALFKQYGCISCHQGAAVGGNMFQVFGVINAYFTQRGNITEADLGRYNVTGNPADKHSFKVPSLRLAAYTAPYLHDGNAATLRDAVDMMFTFQLGREAPDQDKEDIVAFIRSLAGDHPELKK